MQKEVLSTRQAVFICSLFIFASNILIGSVSKVEQDTWMALLMSFALFLPVVLVYARILDLNPEMNIAQISEKVLGKLFGKVIIALMTCYSLMLGSLVVTNFYFYVGVTILQQTPHYYVAGLLVLVCIYMAKSGVEVLGKWSYAATIFALVALIFTIVLSYNQYEIERLLPVGEHEFGEIFELACARVAYPFAEIVLFLFLGHALRKEYSSYKILLTSSIIGLMSLLILVVRNILVLGPELISAVYFPSYIAARVISVSTFLTKVEGSISMNYIVSGIVKISVCLFASAIGLSSLFGIADYKKLVVPTGIIIFALCMINYPGIIEMFRFLEVYQYFAILFQIVIPVIIWIASEIRARKQKKSAAKPRQ